MTETEGATPDTSQASEAATILVVDDNEANRVLAKNTLEDEGYRVVLASNGADGISAFERERPDCVLLDVRMPELDGFVVCGRIRALPRGGEVSILFLTALRDVDTFDHALRAGGDDFLTKPVRPTELVVRVQTALKLQRLGSERREHVELMRRQRDDLMRLQLQKERLMAFVVHDLKNPVNSMDLSAQFLLRERGLPEGVREAALQIRTEARRLTHMILNLLDLSKADEGKLSAKLSEVDLGALVTDVFAELEAGAQAAGVRLARTLQVERTAADEDLLRRALTNLAENAIRHAPRGSSVTIASAAREGGVELRVSDTGSGVPTELWERIFDPFVQVDSGHRTVSRSGRGLGLALCKLAALTHGGRIWIEDNAPGAVFCIWVPK